MIRDAILIMIGMVLMIILNKLKEAMLNARTRTAVNVVLTEEQVKEVQKLIESFRLEEKGENKNV